MANERLIGHIFSNLFDDINGFAYLTEVKGLVIRKRQRATSTQEFQQVMAGNMNYFNQLNEEYYQLVQTMVQNREFLTPQELKNKVMATQGALRGQGGLGQEAVLQGYTRRYQTDYDRIEAMEFDYCYRNIESDFLLQFLFALVEPANRAITQPLLSLPPAFVLAEVRKYMGFYTSHILQSSVIKGGSHS